MGATTVQESRSRLNSTTKETARFGARSTVRDFSITQTLDRLLGIKPLRVPIQSILKLSRETILVRICQPVDIPARPKLLLTPSLRRDSETEALRSQVNVSINSRKLSRKNRVRR